MVVAKIDWEGPRRHRLVVCGFHSTKTARGVSRLIRALRRMFLWAAQLPLTLKSRTAPSVGSALAFDMCRGESLRPGVPGTQQNFPRLFLSIISSVSRLLLLFFVLVVVEICLTFLTGNSFGIRLEAIVREKERS